MKKALKASFIVLLAVAGVATLVVGHLGSRSSQAHEFVREGAVAYRQGSYRAAISYFQEALRLDPKLKIAQMDLANTYARQYLQADDPIEMQMDLQLGMEEYHAILEDDPQNPEALQALASLYYSAGKEDEGKRYLRLSTQAVQQLGRAQSAPAADEDVPPPPSYHDLEGWRREIRGVEPAPNNTVHMSSSETGLPYAMVEPNLIHKVRPEYPEMAKIAHVEGDVVLQAVISKSGTVTNVKAINGHPILIQSAMNAVRQWRYRPFLHNGKPVEVQTTITIKFPL